VGRDVGHLRGKVLYAHTCNLYDNLPTDELMRVGDRAYEPLVRASITPGEIAELSAKHAIARTPWWPRRSGFRVDVEPFAHREGSNTVVLSARPRDAYVGPTAAAAIVAAA
jgi:hypothetical protein